MHSFDISMDDPSENFEWNSSFTNQNDMVGNYASDVDSENISSSRDGALPPSFDPSVQEDLAEREPSHDSFRNDYSRKEEFARFDFQVIDPQKCGEGLSAYVSYTIICSSTYHGLNSPNAYLFNDNMSKQDGLKLR